ncbi:MAG: O-antigen ligase family protein [Alphaproteobacteria bacterium]|nr:O-antigen ligase family protein [Alphaproteobacteria bacterium]
MPTIGRLERYLLIAGVLIQQAAFIPLPEALSGAGVERAIESLGNQPDPGSSNPLNFAVTVGYLGIIAVLSFTRLSALVATIKQNPLVIATTALVIASAIWSFDPSLTLRRAVTYSIGVWLALYLVSRCDFDTIVRILAASTVIPAVCSLVYLAVFPDLALMQDEGVQGNLRGVYAHKNQLAEIMTVGYVLQLYLALSTGKWARHGALAALHAVLVVLAKSSTSKLALLLVTALLVWLQVWRFNKHLAVTAGLAALVLMLFAGVWGYEDPEAFFALLGRDPSLTGRTELWPALWPYIVDRIWLGWGYAAFWQVGNDAAQRVWSQVEWPPPHSHNGLLEVMLDFGIVGIGFILVMIGRYGVHAARATALDPGPQSQLFWCLLALTFVANIVEITLLRGQTFPWFCFLVFFMSAAAIGRQTAANAVRAAPPTILARAKPLSRPAAGGGPAQ